MGNKLSKVVFIFRVLYQSLWGVLPDEYEPVICRRTSLPEVTISAFNETGQAESSIDVPKQRAYTSRKPVISSHLANTPCATLGVRGLLNLLNTTLGTSYPLTRSLSSLLKDFIVQNYDFGTACGRLRQVLTTYYRQGTIRDAFCRWEQEDQEMREEALVGNQIVKPSLRPRRVWDLYSNRVVPWWCTGVSTDDHGDHWPRPLSHAWMDPKDRADVQTPINGYEWPVPIPKDADLNLIRIEMLNFGLEYVWLDVLCLRQVGGRGGSEVIRQEEWRLDVPTIGAVYRRPVMCYLSGLGRPLSLKEGDLDSDRSWFRRAWTLQESCQKKMIAGDTPDGPMHAKPIDKNWNYETELLTRFHRQWGHVGTSNTFLLALVDMQNRVSTNPVDKIAGLTFLLQTTVIPAYYESQSLEDAWTALVDSMDRQYRAQMFASYPEPGNAGTKWRPSWDQVMTNPLPMTVWFTPDLNQNEAGEDCCDWQCIEDVFVRGLAVVEGVDRCGELTVKDDRGVEHGFQITAASHRYPIPEGVYTLIAAFPWTSYVHWVIGRKLPDERFEKVSMLDIPNGEESSRLRDLHITKQRRYILV